MVRTEHVMFYLSLALAVGSVMVYVVWGATNDAFLDPGLVPTTVVFAAIGLLGAYVAKLEAKRSGT